MGKPPGGIRIMGKAKQIRYLLEEKALQVRPAMRG